MADYSMMGPKEEKMLGIMDRDSEPTGPGPAPSAVASRSLDAIEKRTAFLKATSRHSLHLYLTRHAVREQRAALAEKLSGESRARVSIRDMDHFAPNWRELVPADPYARAAIANLLRRDFVFTRQMIPQLRESLGLDDADVSRAYMEVFGRPLDTVYVTQLPVAERVRAAGHRLSVRLERLPPFWIAFALTLPVGPGLLALPIALAEIGPLPGVVLLVLFGLINMITVAALAEALTRSSDLRYNNTFFLGHLVNEYLGAVGSLIFSVMMILDLVLVLLIFYLGFAGTLADATNLPSALWAAVLFLIGIYFLSRKSLNTTLGFTIVVGIINVSLILVLTLLALTRLDLSNLLYVNVPFVNGNPFDPAAVRLVFGVILATYFSHILIGNYGKLVLRHDPSGRALIQGSVAAIAATTVMSVLWVLAINGALDPSTLGSQAGTVLVPLSARVGVAVRAIGSLFVVLGLGMASIHISLGLGFTLKEWLMSERIRNFARREPLQTILTVSPVVGVFLVAEWMLITGTGSFSELFGLVGVVALSLFAGIYPMLLLLAGRRKGELIPKAGVYRFLANPFLIGGIYMFFLSAIFFHGFVLWEDPGQRAGAILIGTAITIATGVMLRHKAFAPRVVVGLRGMPISTNGIRIGAQDLRGIEQAEFSVAYAGKPHSAQVRMVYPDGVKSSEASGGEVPDLSRLGSMEFRLPASQAGVLKVWAYRVHESGDSESLPLTVEIHSGPEMEEFDLHDTGGQVVVPLKTKTPLTEIVLRNNSGSST